MMGLDGSGMEDRRRELARRWRSTWPRRVAAAGISTVTISMAALYGPVAASADSSYQVTATAVVGSGTNNAFSISADLASDTIYAANYGDGTLSVIDGASNTVTATVALGSGSHPLGVAVDPSADIVYVGVTGGVDVIDGATDAVTGSITDANDPDGLAVDPDTGRLYIANNSNGSLWVVDESTDAVVGKVSLGSGNEATGVTVDPTADAAYVAIGNSDLVYVVNGATDTVTTTITVGTGPFGIGANPNTGKVYVASENGTVAAIAEATNTVQATVTIGGFPYGLAVDPITDAVFVAGVTGNIVTVIDASTSTPTVETTVSVGSAFDPLAVTDDPDTDAAYAANSVAKGGTNPYAPGTPVSVISPFTTLSVAVSGSQTNGSSSPTFSTTPPAPPDGDSFTGTATCTTVGDPATTISSTLPVGTYSLNGSSCSGIGLTGPTAFEYQIAYTGGTFSVSPLGTVKLSSPTSGEPGYPTCSVPGNVTNKCSVGVKIKVGAAYANTEVAVTECNTSVTSGDPNACTVTSGSKPGDEVLVDTNSKGTATVVDYPVLVSGKKAVGDGSCAAGDTCYLTAEVVSTQTQIGTPQAFTAG